MPRDPNIGFQNVVFERGNADGPPETFTAIEGFDEITPGARTREVLEDLHFDLEDGYKDKYGGLRDGGEYMLKFIYDPDLAGPAALAADLDDDEKKTYRLSVTGSVNVHGVTFKGLVSEETPATPLGEKIMVEYKIVVSGKPAYSETPIA